MNRSKEKFYFSKCDTHSTDTVLCVTYKGHTYDFPSCYANVQFACLIEDIGSSYVYHLGLKTDSRDVMTFIRLNKMQYPCGAYWITPPTSILEMCKLINIIKSLLKLDIKTEYMVIEDANEAIVKEIAVKPSALVQRQVLDVAGFVSALHGFFHVNFRAKQLTMLFLDFSLCKGAPSCGFEFSNSIIDKGMYEVPSFVYESAQWKRSIGKKNIILDPVVFIDKTFLANTIDIVRQCKYKVCNMVNEYSMYGFHSCCILM